MAECKSNRLSERLSEAEFELMGQVPEKCYAKHHTPDLLTHRYKDERSAFAKYELLCKFSQGF